MALRVVFMGTPDFAVPTLTKIVEAGHEVVAVYTRAPQPAGRGMAEQPLAGARGGARASASRSSCRGRCKIPAARDALRRASRRCRGRRRLRADPAEADPRRAAPRLPQPPRLAAAALARRGADPARHHGRRPETGVMVMRMEEGLDTGPVCLAERVPIGADETAGELHDRLAPLGADLMVAGARRAGGRRARLHAAAATTASPMPRRSTRRRRASTGSGRRPRCTTRSAGSRPSPGAWCEVPRGGGQERVKVLRSERAEGSGPPGHDPQPRPARRRLRRAARLRLIEVQRAGQEAGRGGGVPARRAARRRATVACVSC